LWILRDYDEKNKLVRVEVKNRFNLGENIEIVSPSWVKKSKIQKIYKTNLNHWIHKSTTTFTDTVYTFDKDKSSEVETAHGGWYEVWINMEEKPEDFSLIRKNIEIND
jgi:hypothetical protein